jgi:hypothetical protein
MIWELYVLIELAQAHDTSLDPQLYTPAIRTTAMVRARVYGVIRKILLAELATQVRK